MFRVSRYMQELVKPTPLAGGRVDPPGPVVIWNLVRRCNLACLHCYSISADVDFPGELSTEEVRRVMDDLKAFRVPALVLSGGEPLLRKDIFAIAARSRELGFYTALSTNGTLIDAPLARRIAAAGFDYVGISLDGLRETHDRFRRKQGAFDASLAGLRRCRDAGVRVGLRFTLTQDNAHDLEALLDLAEGERIHKFYFSHLNYAGRGERNRARAAQYATARAAVEEIFERCWAHARAGLEREYVTGNNDADAVYLIHWARRRVPGFSEPQLRAKLAEWGGNASGVNVANIDNLGNVHPDTMWWDCTLGNVRGRPFSEIWRDTRHPVMAGLKARPRRLKGRCGACAYADVCGGNTRVRALKATGDPWQEDPGCYLEDEEIGLAQEALA